MTAGPYDLVIVGSGVAGLTAARRSQQLGRRILLVEKSDCEPGFGNGRLSGGWFHAAMWDPKIRSADELYDKIIADTDGHAVPEVARAWADNVRRAYAFLGDEGATFGVLNADEEAMQNVLMPHRLPMIGYHWQGRGPDLLLTRMYRSFIAAGGAFRRRCRAVELATDAEGITGLWVEGDSGRELIAADGVLLCDGGFQGNPELVARYITGAYSLRGSPNDSGDALLMGLAAGAATINMPWFYGYLLCRDALRDERFWMYPAPGALVYAGALVDGTGRRFVDEGSKGEIVANAVARCATPGDCWVVCDSEAWEREGRLGDVPMNPVFGDEGGTIVTAPDLRTLAGATGLPPEALAAAVAEVNRSFGRSAGPTAPVHMYDVAGVAGPAIDRGGHPPSHRPPDGEQAGVPRAGLPRPIGRPPFHAIPVIAGITFAMGGLRVNRHGQVLSEAGVPIAGLYAAGGTMGGLQGGPRIGVAGGWSEATTFGLLVAEHCARVD
jgi:fumarate reductase flavoprotein subunit